MSNPIVIPGPPDYCKPSCRDARRGFELTRITVRQRTGTVKAQWMCTSCGQATFTESELETK